MGRPKGSLGSDLGEDSTAKHTNRDVYIYIYTSVIMHTHMQIYSYIAYVPARFSSSQSKQKQKDGDNSTFFSWDLLGLLDCCYRNIRRRHTLDNKYHGPPLPSNTIFSCAPACFFMFIVLPTKPSHQRSNAFGGSWGVGWRGGAANMVMLKKNSPSPTAKK